MKMKVFDKGQIVIPAKIRRTLGISPGDQVIVALDRERKSIEVRKPEPHEARALAGSLAKYAIGKRLPTRSEMSDSLRKGLRDA